MIRLFILFGIVVAAWFVSNSYPQLARRIAQLMAVAIGVALGVLVATGLSRSNAELVSFHRWVGHVLVIITWLCAPFATGVVVQQQFRNRPIVAVAQVFAILVFLGIASLAAITGYMGPSDSPQIESERFNRFVALHMVVLPTILSALLVAWFWMFSRERGGNKQTSGRS